MQVSFHKATIWYYHRIPLYFWVMITSTLSLSFSLSHEITGKRLVPVWSVKKKKKGCVAMATRSCHTGARLGRALPFAYRLPSWYLVVMTTAHSIPASLRWATSLTIWPQTHLTELSMTHTHTLVFLWWGFPLTSDLILFYLHFFLYYIILYLLYYIMLLCMSHFCILQCSSWF